MVATLNHLPQFVTVRLKPNTDVLGALLAEQMSEKELKQHLGIVRPIARAVLEIGEQRVRGVPGLSLITAVQNRFAQPVLLSAGINLPVPNLLLIIEKTATITLFIGLTHTE